MEATVRVAVEAVVAQAAVETVARAAVGAVVVRVAVGAGCCNRDRYNGAPNLIIGRPDQDVVATGSVAAGRARTAVRQPAMVAD